MKPRIRPEILRQKKLCQLTEMAQEAKEKMSFNRAELITISYWNGTLDFRYETIDGIELALETWREEYDSRSDKDLDDFKIWLVDSSAKEVKKLISLGM